MVRLRSAGTAAALLLALAWVLPSCGYSSRLAFEQGIETVGVELFGNDTLEIDLERELHKEMSDAVRNLIDARLVEPGEADVVLQGKLTRYTRVGGIRSPDNELLQSGITVASEAVLVERVTGTTLAGPFDVSIDVGFSLTGAGMESMARQRALRNLSERIALDLFTASALRASGVEIEMPEKELNQ